MIEIKVVSGQHLMAVTTCRVSDGESLQMRHLCDLNSSLAFVFVPKKEIAVLCQLSIKTGAVWDLFEINVF